MTDYATPTVVTPPIPVALLTEIERFILTTIFDHDLLNSDGGEGEGGTEFLYLHAAHGIDEEGRIDRTAFDRIANAVEPGTDRLVMLVHQQISSRNQRDEPDPIVSFVNELDPLQVLQGVVRRNPDLFPAIVIQQAFTCTRMQADGFGGAATIITADGIESLCTTSWAAARVAALKRFQARPAEEVM